MRDDYLWDRSGAPDPTVERLEHLLSGYRCPESAPARARPRYRGSALAATVLIAAAVALSVAVQPARRSSVWAIDGRAVHVGETLETKQGTTATLSASSVGELRLEPETRVRVTRSGGRQQRLALDRGTLHALIWAPPQEFVVDTPAATTIDLGCEYELHVAADGGGLLTVRRGWVAFQAGAVESFIPAGAACRTRPRTGPGLPYFEDASERFRASVARVEAGGKIEELLAAARPRDALTLWHLLRRVPAGDRGRVAERFVQLVPSVRAESLARAEPAAIEAAWNALALGDTGWWRGWKRNW